MSRHNKLNESKPPEQKPLKIAIIGGGPGGLYTAMRLFGERDKGNNKIYKQGDILIFDAESEIGGRVKTLPLGDAPFTADIGAMRFIKGRQLLISSLIENKFNLQNHSLNTPTFSYYLRDRIILPHTVKGGKIQMNDYSDFQSENSSSNDGKKRNVKDQNAYRLDHWEGYFSPSELLIVAIFSFLAGLDFDPAVPRELFTTRHSVLDKRDYLKRVFWNREKYSGKDYALRIKSFFDDGTAKGFEFFTLKEWNYLRLYGRINDKNLYETCLFNILVKELSVEAITLVIDSFGYNNIFGAANAADHIPWFMNEFGSQGYHTIDKGMSQLIYRIRESINEETDSKDWFRPNYKLVSVTKLDGVYKLEFTCGGKTIIINTEQIILAISKGAIERIHFDTLLRLTDMLSELTGSKNLCDAIQCVTSYPLIKAFLFYSEAWFWDRIPYNVKNRLIDEYEKKEIPRRMNFVGDEDTKDYKLGISRVITDLPIKQIYYHGSLGPWRQPNKDPKAICNGMIMAYGDSAQSQLWASLAGRHKPEHIRPYAVNPAFKSLTNLSDKDYDKLNLEFGATHTLGDILHNNLLSIFQKGYNIDLNTEIKQINAPMAVFVKDWNDAPYFGGWHAWCVNYKPWEIRKYIQMPFKNEKIFIVGETFSSDQGWIEGALRTSEANLRNNFGLKTIPKWIKLSFLNNTSWASGDVTSPEDFENYLMW